MKKEEVCTVLYYVSAVLFYAAAINLLGGNNTSTGIVWLCLESVWMNKDKKNDEEKR